MLMFLLEQSFNFLVLLLNMCTQIAQSVPLYCEFDPAVKSKQLLYN